MDRQPDNPTACWNQLSARLWRAASGWKCTGSKLPCLWTIGTIELCFVASMDRWIQWFQWCFFWCFLFHVCFGVVTCWVKGCQASEKTWEMSPKRWEPGQKNLTEVTHQKFTILQNPWKETQLLVIFVWRKVDLLGVSPSLSKHSNLSHTVTAKLQKQRHQVAPRNVLMMFF